MCECVCLSVCVCVCVSGRVRVFKIQSFNNEEYRIGSNVI